MVMVTIALVMAVIVTNIYAKKDSTERAPDWCIAVVSRFYPDYFLPERSSNDLSGETGSRTKSVRCQWKSKMIFGTGQIKESMVLDKADETNIDHHHHHHR